MRNLSKWLLSFAAALAFAASLFTLSACNTVEGVGEDTEELGEEISETSRDVRD